MKKTLSLILALVFMLCAFASCNTGEPSESTKDPSATTDDGSDLVPEYDFMTEDLTKYITLGAYKGHSVTSEPVKYLTEEEFQTQLNYEMVALGAFTPVKDREVKESDIIDISYVGYYENGKKFDGGSGDAQFFTVYDGGGFIEGFAEGLIGATPGKKVDVHVKFPDDYHSADLAGKNARFSVMVNFICEPKPITDELIAELSQSEVKTAQEFIENARKVMREDAEKMHKNAQLAAMWEAIKADSKQLSLPEAAVEEYYQYTINYYQQYANEAVMTLDDFLKQNGSSREDIRKIAEADVFNDMVVYSVIRAENITLSDEEYKTELKEFAEETSSTEIYILSVYTEEELRNMFLYTKGYESVYEWNTCTDKAEASE